MSGNKNNGVFADCLGIMRASDYAKMCAQYFHDIAPLIAERSVSPQIFGKSSLARQCANRIVAAHQKVSDAIFHGEQSYYQVNNKLTDLVDQLTHADSLVISPAKDYLTKDYSVSHMPNSLPG